MSFKDDYLIYLSKKRTKFEYFRLGTVKNLKDRNEVYLKFYGMIDELVYFKSFSEKTYK